MGEGRKTPVRKPRQTRAKNIQVTLHMPGEMPKNVKVPTGATVSSIIDELNLDGYEIRVNGRQVSSDAVLTPDSTIRVGVKTKNG